MAKNTKRPEIAPLVRDILAGLGEDPDREGLVKTPATHDIDSFIKPWVEPDHKLPALVLWGGSEDICVVINFENASKALEEKLVAGNHFIVECIHNCGHTAPPVEAPPGLSAFGGIWKFAFDHPYWLNPGVSSYNTSFPSELPTWCAAGAGSATPREGECPPNDACQ